MNCAAHPPRKEARANELDHRMVKPGRVLVMAPCFSCHLAIGSHGFSPPGRGSFWPAPLRYGLLVLAMLKFAFPPLLPRPTGLFSLTGPKVTPASAAAEISMPRSSSVETRTTAFPLRLVQPRAFPRLLALNPKTEVKSRHAQGARPSGRFNVHLASGSNTHQTMPTVKRRERRAPAIRPGSQFFCASVFGLNQATPR
jgi:hypothetical protein